MAMDTPLSFENVTERGGDRQAHRAPLFGSQLVDSTGQRAARQVLHHHQTQTLGLQAAVNPHHMRMVQPGQHPRLGGELRR